MGEITYFTQEEYAAFREKIKTLHTKKMPVEKIQVMFDVLCSGAMRVNEVLDLEPDDILNDGRLRIKRAKGGWKRCDCSKWKYRPTVLISSNPDCTKCKGNGKYRVYQYTFLPEAILATLKQFAELVPKGNKIFPISDRQVLNYVDELVGGRTHAFRHSWLTWLVQSNKVDLARVRDMARHTSLATTDRYVQRNPALTRQEVTDVSKDFI